jgi:hypothetical protein
VNYGRNGNIQVQGYLSRRIGASAKDWRARTRHSLWTPIAEIVAPGALKPARRLGTMAGTGRIIGDIVGPIGDESDWDAAKE